MTKIIKVQCAYCGNTIDKQLGEYKRQIKKDPNKRFFCDLSCVAFQRNIDNPPKGNLQNLKPDNKKDIHSPFRWFIKCANSRIKKNSWIKRNLTCDITPEYLEDIWHNQNGICIITGKKMILPKNTQGWSSVNPYNASLDRIDNSKGYIKGNVRFISYMANTARGIYTDEQLIEFCKTVANFN